MKLHELARAVKTREDLHSFVKVLVKDLAKGMWENKDLASYLDWDWLGSLEIWTGITPTGEKRRPNSQSGVRSPRCSSRPRCTNRRVDRFFNSSTAAIRALRTFGARQCGDIRCWDKE